MGTYKCIRKCYFGKGETVLGKAPPKRIYQVGDTEVFEAGERIPRHFVPLEHAVIEPSPMPSVMKGLRAPLDRDQLNEIEKKKRKSILDDHKREGEEQAGRMPKSK